MKYLIGCFFIYLILSFGISKNLKSKKLNDSRVIKVYYEPLCPDSIEYFNSSLRDFYQNFDSFKSEFRDIQFIPGGKTKYSTSSNNVTFKCLHGYKECLGNKFHACAINQLSQELSKEYIFCYMRNILAQGMYRDNYKVSKKCANDLNFDYNILKNCVDNSSDEILLNLIKDRKNLSEKIYYVPWVTIDDNFDLQRLKLIEEDMLAYMCQNYDFSNNISVCKNKNIY
jgi:hypothetical protein